MKKVKKILMILAVVFYILSGYLFYRGFDKMTNYYQSDNYPSLNVNAYVGGDAYNYIINSNYAAGYYVLSMGCLLTGSVFVCTDLIVNALEKFREELQAREELRKREELQEKDMDTDSTMP